MSARHRNFLAPLMFGALVLILGATLLTVGARSPFTHLNLTTDVVSGFQRTPQIVVGPAQPINPGDWEMSMKTNASASLAQQGASLFMSLDCASCHGLKGQGGVFAPVIASSSASVIKAKTSAGPGGMPKFAGLTDHDLNALAAYLASVAKPTATH